MDRFQPLFLATRFLTRLPAPVSKEGANDPTLQGKAVLYYPLVGVTIGLLLAVLDQTLGGSSNLLKAGLLLAFWVWVTGALHLDGLADLADAWVGGYGSADRTLEIMKDSRSGPVAVVTLVVVLLVKFSALTVLVDSTKWSLLIVAPLLGRTALTLMFLSMPYLRAEGMGRTQADNLPYLGAKWMVAAAGGLTILLLGGAALFLLLLATVLFVLFRRTLLERIGGFTGDAAGAACELTEVVVLVFIALSL